MSRECPGGISSTILTLGGRGSEKEEKDKEEGEDREEDREEDKEEAVDERLEEEVMVVESDSGRSACRC